jgi:FtsH-binding integral membrane protein
MRKFAAVIAILLVAVTSVLGLIQLPNEYRNDQGSLLQMSVAVGATLHAVLGVVLVIVVVRRKRWAARVAIAWTAVVVYTASVASVAFEPQRDSGVIIGGVAAGITCALIGWWVTWAAKELTSRHIPVTPDLSTTR